MKRSAQGFIIIGFILLLLSVYFYYQRSNPSRLKILTYKVTDSIKISQGDKIATSIMIPDLGIDLPIVPSVITDQAWETSDTGVSYLINSPVPGERGNSILYGHNWPAILGALPGIKPDQKIYITYNDGSKARFKVEYAAEISPVTVGILDQTKDNRITIYTCTGFLDSKRFVAVALLDGPLANR